MCIAVTDSCLPTRPPLLRAMLPLVPTSTPFTKSPSRLTSTGRRRAAAWSASALMPIVPEASEDGSVARARLREATTKFSAQHALCFREEERQRLLAIMESAYGAFEPFNLLVRQVVTGGVRYVQDPDRRL